MQVANPKLQRTQGDDGDESVSMKCSPSHASLHDFGEASIGAQRFDGDDGDKVDEATNHNDCNTTTTYTTTTHGLKATEAMAQSIPVQDFGKVGLKATEVTAQSILVQGFGKVMGARSRTATGNTSQTSFRGAGSTHFKGWFANPLKELRRNKFVGALPRLWRTS